jgi:hypothetical protein
MKTHKGYLFRAYKGFVHHHLHFVRDSKVSKAVGKVYGEKKRDDF